jgi:hypothetical protein
MQHKLQSLLHIRANTMLQIRHAESFSLQKVHPMLVVCILPGFHSNVQQPHLSYNITQPCLAKAQTMIPKNHSYDDKMARNVNAKISQIVHCFLKIGSLRKAGAF